MLNKELAVMPILSSSFDSLWHNVQELPSRQQAVLLLKVSSRNEKETGGIQKQERIILEGLPSISKKEKKENTITITRFI
ncbi:MAG: hypothetical protein ACLVEJ_00980 [Parabacteroides sp.]